MCMTDLDGRAFEFGNNYLLTFLGLCLEDNLPFAEHEGRKKVVRMHEPEVYELCVYSSSA